MSTPSRAGTSIIWALLESGGLSGLSLLTLLILARLVGPTELGVAALALGAVQILTILVEMLLHDALVQRRELDPRHASSAFWFCLVLGIVLCLICWLGAPIYARIFEHPELASVLPVTGLSLVASGAGCVPIALLRREGNFRALAVRSLFGRLAGAVVGIAIAFSGGGVWAIVIQNVIQVAMATLLVWPTSRWRPSPVFDLKHVGQLLAFGIFSIGSRIVWILTVRMFTLFCGYMFGATAAGYLNIAQRMVDTLYDLLAGAAYNVSLPFFSRRQDDPPALMRAYSRAVELAALSSFPIFGGIAICAPAIIAAFLGKEWLPAAPIMSLLATAALCQFLFLFAHVALVASGRPENLFLVSSFSSIFVFGALFLVHPGSIMEASILWVARVFATGPLILFLAYRSFGAVGIEPFKAALWPLTAVLLMAGAITLADQHVLAGLPPIISLALMVLMGAVIYTGVIALAHRAAVHRLFDLVGTGLRGLRFSS
jgi:O-antigen/teichoic acid export membrane protein